MSDEHDQTLPVVPPGVGRLGGVARVVSAALLAVLAGPLGADTAAAGGGADPREAVLKIYATQLSQNFGAPWKPGNSRSVSGSGFVVAGAAIGVVTGAGRSHAVALAIATASTTRRAGRAGIDAFGRGTAQVRNSRGTSRMRAMSAMRGRTCRPIGQLRTRQVLQLAQGAPLRPSESITSLAAPRLR